MGDAEYKRLRRLILRSFFFVLAVFVVLAFAGSYQLKNLKSQFVGLKSQTIVKQTIVKQTFESPLKPVNGTNGNKGQNGIDGINGVNGVDGTNGVSITPEQIASAVASYLQLHPPPKGANGEPGVPGKIVFVQINPVTGVLECRYSGDTMWQPIGDCQ